MLLKIQVVTKRPREDANLTAVRISAAIQQNVPLGPLTTLGVGGQARHFLPAASEADVRAAVQEAGERGWPLFVLGGGSNLVIADAGWPGLVLRIALRGVRQQSTNGRIAFDVAAGEEWEAFVARTVAE